MIRGVVHSSFAVERLTFSDVADNRVYLSQMLSELLCNNTSNPNRNWNWQ